MSVSGFFFLLYRPLHWHPQTGPSDWRDVPTPLSPLRLVHPQHQQLQFLAATAFRYPEVLLPVSSRTDLSRQVEVLLLSCTYLLAIMCLLYRERKPTLQRKRFLLMWRVR